MNRSMVVAVFLLGAIAGAATTIRAATVPFTEDFTSSVANWGEASGIALLTHVASGGPDGGAFASTSFSLAGLGDKSVVLMRGQDEFNSSGHAFEGNWISQGVGTVTAYVRHNAPQPLTFFGRFALPGNTPAATAVRFVPVPPQAWTQLSFAVTPSNPAFVTFEGTDFETVFSNIGHVQFGISVPAALNGLSDPISFGLDKVSIAPVPEPASWLMAAMIAVVAIVRRRGC